MDPSFKPYRTGNVLVMERYPCGRGVGLSKGRNLVYYLCKCELCGRESVLSGDDVSKHPYSCECAPKPNGNRYGLGYKDGTMLSMLKRNKRVRCDSSSGVTGVYFEKKRNKWVAEITLKGKGKHLGSFDSKEDAIKARAEGEKKYFEPLLNDEKKGN